MRSYIKNHLTIRIINREQYCVIQIRCCITPAYVKKAVTTLQLHAHQGRNSILGQLENIP